MIRLSANLSKKVPLPGVEYSSQQYGASLEIEVSDADKPDAIQSRIRELYSLLSGAIDEQIGVARPIPANVRTLPPPVAQIQQQAVQSLPAQQRNGYVNGNVRNRVATMNGNGNGRTVAGSTPSQQKAIWAISKNIGANLPEILSQYGVTDAKELSVKQSSELIDSLKAIQNGAA